MGDPEPALKGGAVKRGGLYVDVARLVVRRKDGKGLAGIVARVKLYAGPVENGAGDLVAGFSAGAACSNWQFKRQMNSSLARTFCVNEQLHQFTCAYDHALLPLAGKMTLVACHEIIGVRRFRTLQKTVIGFVW